MGKKIWLSLNVRNFGSDKIVRTYLSNVRMYILLPLYVSLGKIWHFKHPRVLAVIRIVTHLDFQREKKQQQRRDVFSTKFYCLLAVTWITEKELEREMKNKDEFRWKRNMRILQRDEKMSGSEKKNGKQKHNRHFFRNTCSQQVSLYSRAQQRDVAVQICQKAASLPIQQVNAA